MERSQPARLNTNLARTCEESTYSSFAASAHAGGSIDGHKYQAENARNIVTNGWENIRMMVRT